MNGKNPHSFDTVFVLLVFCLFSVCSLFVVLIGANVYRSIVGEMESNNETRASLSYVSNKVHYADPGAASIRTVDGVEALVIDAQYSGEDYRTYIYVHQGYLMELFTKAENPFTPGDGEKITEITKFSMEQNGRQLSLSAAGKNQRTLKLNVDLG
jgi:hypothetical protein